jgi:hypothetical protein
MRRYTLVENNPGTANRWNMTEKAYVVRFKRSELSTLSVTATSAEIQGDHVVLLNSKGKLAALFLMDLVESLSEFQIHSAD